MKVNEIEFTEQEIRTLQEAAGGPIFGVLRKTMDRIYADAQEAFENPACNLEILKVNQGKVVALNALQVMLQKVVDFSFEEMNGDIQTEEEEAIDVDF